MLLLNMKRICDKLKNALKNNESRFEICGDYWGFNDDDGERALQAVKDDMPSKRQTRYNQRDLRKRKLKRALCFPQTK